MALLACRPDRGAPEASEYASMEGNTVRRIVWQAGDKADRVLQIRGPTDVEVEQFLQCVRLRNAVGVEDPDPVEAVFQGVGETSSNGATRAEVLRMANDGDSLGKRPIQSPI